MIVETVTKKRKAPDGVATNDLVLSAHTGTNDQVFPQVLSLYVEPGSTVADVTYGRGVFWRAVPKDAYRLLASDLQDGVDCRDLPYESGSIDCVVFDPPPICTHQAGPRTSITRTSSDTTRTTALRLTRSTTKQCWTSTSQRPVKPGASCAGLSAAKCMGHCHLFVGADTGSAATVLSVSNDSTHEFAVGKTNVHPQVLDIS